MANLLMDLRPALKRFEAWWLCSMADRPPITVSIPRASPVQYPSKHHDSERQRWFDPQHALSRFEAEVSASTYLAETFPIFMPNLGPEICATVFGCELEFGEHTSWSLPRAGSIREILDYQPNLDNVYWTFIRQLTDLSLRRGAGRWLTAVTDLHTNGDLLASLRDPQELALDLADDTAAVSRACDWVTHWFGLMFDDIWHRIRAGGQPCTTWTPALHGCAWYPLSCDFICMIPPDMFNRVILPALAEEAKCLDRRLFHLDGPGALKHLDSLLAQDWLHGVQWVYGAGHGPAERWIDVYRRIQKAGKCIQLIAAHAADAKAVARQLDPHGVWIHTSASSRSQAEDLIAWVEQWAQTGRT